MTSCDWCSKRAGWWILNRRLCGDCVLLALKFGTSPGTVLPKQKPTLPARRVSHKAGVGKEEERDE